MFPVQLRKKYAHLQGIFVPGRFADHDRQEAVQLFMTVPIQCFLKIELNTGNHIF